jgi:hypothetical protein
VKNVLAVSLKVSWHSVFSSVDSFLKLLSRLHVVYGIIIAKATVTTYFENERTGMAALGNAQLSNEVTA